jgi:hypothetical protein
MGMIKKIEPRSKHDAHMDALLKKVSAVFDGVSAFDAALVSAACCAWAIFVSQEKESVHKQQAMLEHTIEFLRNQVEHMKASEGTGRLWPQ